MERVSWFNSAVEETQTQHFENRAHLLELVQGFLKRMMACQAKVDSGNSDIDKTKQLKGTRIMGICEIAHKRRDQLIEAGESQASAELDAYAEVIRSNDGEIVALRRAIQKCDQDIVKGQSKVDNAKGALDFYESMANLLEGVAKQQEHDIKVRLRYFSTCGIAFD